MSSEPKFTPRPRTTPRITLAAFRTITRPLIHADGRYNRRAIFARARADLWRGATWRAALKDAWTLARRQLERARAHDALTLYTERAVARFSIAAPCAIAPYFRLAPHAVGPRRCSIDAAIEARA